MQYPWIKDGIVIFRYVLCAQFLLAVIIGFITDQLPPAFFIGLVIFSFALVVALVIALVVGFG